MPAQMTLLPAIVIILIAALLAFWLFAPAGWVTSSLNAVGGVVDKVANAIGNFFKGLFGKKS